MGMKTRRRFLMFPAALVLLFLVMLVVQGVSGSSNNNMEEDEKECAEELGNLASCIPYVSGSAAKPTKQCCDDTVKLRAAKPKCLCVLIKESTDPAMALPVNTTLALNMPSHCNINAKVSDCPSILKLPPDSPDAKIFTQAGADSTDEQSSPSSGTSSPTSASGSGTTSTVPEPDKKKTPASSDGSNPMKMTAVTGLLWPIIALVLFA